MDQIDIIKGCKQGQEKAFKALIDQYAPTLMAVCIRYVKDVDQAKDVLQESMIAIFKSINAYAGTGSFEGWLKKIVVRECLRDIRNKKQLFDLTVVDLQDTNGYSDSYSFGAEDLMTVINKLPELQRIIFNMHIVEGYNHAEIGNLLGIPESSSRVYLTRARKSLQEKIEGSKYLEASTLKYKS